MRTLPGSDAVEYSLRFRNSGSQRSGVLERVDSLALSFDGKELNDSYVLSCGGGTVDGVYPPQAFAIRKQYFDPTLPSDGAVTLTTRGGRSSNLDLPFYFIHNDDQSAGIAVAIGWTGQWSSSISAEYRTASANAKSSLRLRGGIPNLRLSLESGEEISGPTILVLTYSGSLSDGSNQFRRLIRDHYTPKLDSNPFQVIATYDAWWNIEEHYDENLLHPIADTAASLGEEYFLLDAAWYIGSNGPEGFSGGVGNWDKVDTVKFPAGLDHFAEYVRSKGLKFGLWFEPERVHRDSLLAREHADWVIWLDNENHYGLLDYGRVEVQQWVQAMMDRYIDQLDIRYIRHDFNIDPLEYWEAHDSPERRGISQIRHMEGFYRVIDGIRTRHPATVLECCASGGRRIDLETARRFHTYWISDDTIDPVVNRFHLQGINHFLPGNYSYIQYTLPVPSQREFVPRDFDYLCCFAGAFGTGGRIDAWPDTQKQRFVLLESIHKGIRSFLMEDYYCLLPQAADLKNWNAWQFHDPKSGSGFVQVFRDHSPVQTTQIKLCGLQRDRKYKFNDPISSRTLESKGAAAMEEGLSFEVEKMSSQLLLYHPQK